ncbi:retrovirus-related Pol polyprotein from transposon RE1 [Trichonephila clavipes]|uniref:Retrovirus-related Pol polyprotein from transposon RE1 n=1 Tax=Trichonephila clavipes TaxID=2585209 RepID=A0A8X7BE61_TRICX|nr:retrovirus-related Pol polyprotein from transposon RE1 [Trichonephila clavipes]
MEFNNQISVLTPNNWNTWKHDMQVLLMHYGCWQFIVQTKPEQPDEEATYKEKLDLQLREDVGIFISRVKTAATRLQEAGHKLDDLYIGFQLIRWLPQEFQSTVQQIYRWKEEDFRVVKIEAELILEANRLQLMKQDLEKAENAYLSSFTSKKSKTLPGATAAAHGDPNGKNDYQKKSGKVFNCKTIKNDKQSIKTIGPCYVCNKYEHLKVNCKEKKSLQKSPSTVNETFNTEFDKGLWVIDTAATSHFCNDKSLFLDLKPITNMKMSLATEDKSCPVEGIGTLRFRVKYKGSFHEITLTDVLFNPKLRRNLLSGSRLERKGAHFVGTKDENKLVETINVRFDENKRGINFRQKVNYNLGYNLNLPDYYDDEDDSDRVKDSLTSRLVSKTSTETPSTSEKPDVSSDNHSLIPCPEVKWIRNIDLSEQQEALMVEVTIPNCYKQAIRSRDASKWHDAMDKEINVMKERKVWDLVDHPDNIKILENRWVYTIKYDENNKIVRYKARLVARGNTQLRGESFDEVPPFEGKNKNVLWRKAGAASRTPFLSASSMAVEISERTRNFVEKRGLEWLFGRSVKCRATVFTYFTLLFSSASDFWFRGGKSFFRNSRSPLFLSFSFAHLLFALILTAPSGFSTLVVVNNGFFPPPQSRATYQLGKSSGEVAESDAKYTNIRAFSAAGPFCQDFCLLRPRLKSTRQILEISQLCGSRVLYFLGDMKFLKV